MAQYHATIELLACAQLEQQPGLRDISAMLNKIKDSKGKLVVIITNMLDLLASEISCIYRHRWQIELFFKWIKQHLKIKHFYGLSLAAVENQIFIALITYCLALLLPSRTGSRGPLLHVTQLLKNCICLPFIAFIKLLKREAARFSKGRRKLKDEMIIYRFTVKQVMSGDLDSFKVKLFYATLLKKYIIKIKEAGITIQDHSQSVQNFSFKFLTSNLTYLPPSMEINMPAATAVPITPATYGLCP